MAILTNEWELKLLKHIFGHTKLDIPSNLYLGLHSGTPTEASPSTGELSGSGYSRYHLVDNVHNGTNTSSTSGMFTKFSFSTNDSITNYTAIDFPEATGSWGTVSYYSVWDNATATTASNCLMIGAFSSGIAVGSGDQFRIAVGEFDLTFPAKMGMGFTAMTFHNVSEITPQEYNVGTEWRRQVARRLGFMNEPWNIQNVSGSGYNHTSNYDWADVTFTNTQAFNIAINNRNAAWPNLSLAYWDDTYATTEPTSSGSTTSYEVVGNSLYLGLYKSDPGSNPTIVTNGGTGELIGNGYARQQLIYYNSDSVTYNTVFGTPSTSNGVSSIANSSAIAFPEAGADWGQITHWGIYRGFYHPTYGNSGPAYKVDAYGTVNNSAGHAASQYPFLTGALTTPRTVNSGDILRFGIGDFVIKLD